MSHFKLAPDLHSRYMIENTINNDLWKCNTNENTYKTDTLIGNWNEERHELEKRKIAECLPSQFGHYFDTIYNSSFNTVPKSRVPEILKNLKGRYPHAHPHHQPELDGDEVKVIYNSWVTTHRADYLDPRIRMQPVFPEIQLKDQLSSN